MEGGGNNTDEGSTYWCCNCNCGRVLTNSWGHVDGTDYGQRYTTHCCNSHSFHVPSAFLHLLRGPASSFSDTCQREDHVLFFGC